MEKKAYLGLARGSLCGSPCASVKNHDMADSRSSTYAFSDSGGTGAAGFRRPGSFDWSKLTFLQILISWKT